MFLLRKNCNKASHIQNHIYDKYILLSEAMADIIPTNNKNARVIKTTDEYFEKLCRESLHLGHLKGKEKDAALRKYYGYEK